MLNLPCQALITLNSSSYLRETNLVLIDQQSVRVVLAGFSTGDHQTFYKFYLPPRTFDSTIQAFIHSQVHRRHAAANDEKQSCLSTPLTSWCRNSGLSIFFNDIVAGIGPCLGLNTDRCTGTRLMVLMCEPSLLRQSV